MLWKKFFRTAKRWPVDFVKIKPMTTRYGSTTQSRSSVEINIFKYFKRVFFFLPSACYIFCQSWSWNDFQAVDLILPSVLGKQNREGKSLQDNTSFRFHVAQSSCTDLAGLSVPYRLYITTRYDKVPEKKGRDRNDVQTVEITCTIVVYSITAGIRPVTYIWYAMFRAFLFQLFFFCLFSPRMIPTYVRYDQQSTFTSRVSRAVKQLLSNAKSFPRTRVRMPRVHTRNREGFWQFSGKF